MSNSWSIYIIALVTLNIIGIVWLLLVTAKHKPEDDSGEKLTTGHKWDGVEELNMPLPKWWIYLFIGTVIFSVVYLVLYPGMGSFQGVLAWSQAAQYEAEAKAVNAQYEKVFAQYKELSPEQLSKNDGAMGIAQRLFANNCSTCHGSDAGGAKGFPNLRDNDWLYGNDIAQIKHSIKEGRSGMMPALGAAVGEDGTQALAVYVKSLSDPTVKQQVAEQHLVKGQKKFNQFCSVCHGANAKGNPAFGAPNLSDNIWLYGGEIEDIKASVRNGRKGAMPAHKSILTDNEITFLAAYIYRLSGQ